MTYYRDDNLVAVPPESCVRLVSDEGDPQRATATVDPPETWDADDGAQPPARLRGMSTADFLEKVVGVAVPPLARKALDAHGYLKPNDMPRYRMMEVPPPPLVPSIADVAAQERRRIARSLGIDLDDVRTSGACMIGPAHRPDVIRGQLDVLLDEGIINKQMYINMHRHYLGRDP